MTVNFVEYPQKSSTEEFVLFNKLSGIILIDCAEGRKIQKNNNFRTKFTNFIGVEYEILSLIGSRFGFTDNVIKASESWKCWEYMALRVTTVMPGDSKIISALLKLKNAYFGLNSDKNFRFIERLEKLKNLDIRNN